MTSKTDTNYRAVALDQTARAVEFLDEVLPVGAGPTCCRLLYECADSAGHNANLLKGLYPPLGIRYEKRQHWADTEHTRRCGCRWTVRRNG